MPNLNCSTKHCSLEDARRVRGMAIGAGLRHLRAAAALNLANAPDEQIQPEVAKAIDAVATIVWVRERTQS